MGIEDLKKLKNDKRGPKPEQPIAGPGRPQVDPHREAIAKSPQEDPRNPQREAVVPRKEDPSEESPGEIKKMLGIKTMPEKQPIAEEVTQHAKDTDVTDLREETTDKGYRHDMVIPQNPTIPPTIAAEREKAGLHPETGLAEDRSEREQRHREAEDAATKHKKAEEDETRRRDKAAQLPADKRRNPDDEIDPELERDEIEPDEVEEEKDADDEEAELKGK
jgi:hypothetical protein